MDQQKVQRTIDQVSGKPYLDHLLAVGAMAAKATDMGYEIGLCHDLLEDSRPGMRNYPQHY